MFLFLFSIGFRSIREIKKEHWKWVAISGFVSSFFPPFLFATAQTQIGSGITSILNSIEPLNTIIVGALLFGIGVTIRQVWGVIIGLVGTIMLILGGLMAEEGGLEAAFSGNTNFWYSGLVIIATIGYALNVNIIKKYLSSISALAVTTGNFLFIFLPGLAVLYWTGFFETIWNNPQMQQSAVYVVLLSLVGTAVAKVLFNKMVQIASPVFASSVTYTMPIVAVGWGVLDGERFGFIQIVAAVVILIGVYLSNRRSR